MARIHRSIIVTQYSIYIDSLFCFFACIINNSLLHTTKLRYARLSQQFSLLLFLHLLISSLLLLLLLLLHLKKCLNAARLPDDPFPSLHLRQRTTKAGPVKIYARTGKSPVNPSIRSRQRTTSLTQQLDRRTRVSRH